MQADDLSAPRETGANTAARLQLELDRILEELLPAGTKAALINYPNHHNVGDPALYLGTLAVLKRIGVRVTYRCEHRTYARQVLAAELRRGTDVILINGGGNLGDQYPQQLGRERVLRDFPEVRTIQLAQSIWFEREDRLAEFARLVAAHSNLTLLLRDRASLQLAERRFDALSKLCPDMAFGLGPLARPTPPSQDIVWLKRADREAAVTDVPPTEETGIEPTDWLRARPTEVVGDKIGLWLLSSNRWLSERVVRHSSMWRPLAWTFVPLARRRVAFGCRLLAQGRVVITDRLHGVVLAHLMGIPAVAIDNLNGKVSSFVQTWLADVPGVKMARDDADAVRIARDLLDEGDPRDVGALASGRQ